MAASASTADRDVDPSWAAFQDVSVAQFLSYDNRPTFVLDLQKVPLDPDQPVPTTFINPALRKNEQLLDLIARSSPGDHLVNKADHRVFYKWIQNANEGTAVAELLHEGVNWHCITLSGRWRIFVADATQSRDVGNVLENTSAPTHEKPSALDVDIRRSTSSAESESATHPLRAIDDDISISRKELNPTATARDFLVREPPKVDIAGLTKHTVSSPPTEINADSDTTQSKLSTPHVVPDDCIAERNAELLAKISAFDAIGISITNRDGHVVFANDAYYRICGLPYGPLDPTKWMGIFEEAEVPKIAEIWKRIIVDQEVEQFQTPLRWRWNPSNSAAIASDTTDFPVWISVWAYPDVSHDGQTKNCCCLLTDISQQKWTEHLVEQQLLDAVERAKTLEQLSKDLASTEDRFRRISDSMPHGVFVCNLAGNMLYTNPAYREVFPSAADPTAAEPWWTYIPEEELGRATEIWNCLKEDRIKVSFEMSFLKFSKPADGSAASDERRYISCSSYPELDGNGDIKHIAGCITDISHLKIAEQTQEARADDAEASKIQLEKFIDMTSHEIRNPLSAIVHSAEEVLTLLRSYPGGLSDGSVTDAIDTMETIIECTSHSTSIVDDILMVSKLNSGLISINPMAVQIVPAVQKALKMFDGQMRAAGISQSVIVDESFEKLQIDWVLLDISRVLQVLVNLITNAIKFTKPEKIRRISTLLRASTDKPASTPGENEPQYLLVQTQPAASYLDPSTTTEGRVIYISISVTDSGCGLLEDDQKNLFQRFSQAKGRTHIKYGGTGLGLFISRQLCEIQGGQIGLYSTPGKGSTFAFYVKALTLSPPEGQGAKHDPVGLRFGNLHAGESPALASLEGAAAVATGSGPSKFEPTILLVEDNLVNQKVVARMLRAMGLTVMVAHHGSEALDHIRDSALFSGALTTAPKLSLVLLDIEMPVMDGLTCVRRIRRMEASGELRNHVPVIAVTANARQEQVNEAIEAGMDSVITKPFRKDPLLKIIKQLLERYPI